MKGMIQNFWIFLSIVAIIMAMMAFWAVIESNAQTAGVSSQERLFGIFGSVLFGGLAARKKGIVLTTTLLATVIFVVVVAIALFLIFAGVQSSAGSTGGGFFYGAFDAIMKMLPGSG